MTLEELITKHQKALGDLDKTILRYVLDNKQEVQQLGITELFLFSFKPQISAITNM